MIRKSSLEKQQLSSNPATICRACGLYQNQTPLIDVGKVSSVFWIGLSAVKISEVDELFPLAPSTRTGALVSRIEEPFIQSISFYRTNLVKCLPLKEGKIRYPLKQEMERCYPNLQWELKTWKPKVVFLLGQQVASFVAEKMDYSAEPFAEEFMFKAFEATGILYVPVHHPSYILVYRRKMIESYVQAIRGFLAPLASSKPVARVLK